MSIEPNELVDSFDRLWQDKLVEPEESEVEAVYDALESYSDEELEAIYQELAEPGEEKGAEQDPACWSSNYLEICNPPPKRVIASLPDRDQIRTYLRAAAEQGESFRAIGSGWGMSQAAVSRDWLLPMSASFDRVLDIFERNKKHYCRFEGGARISTIAQELEAQGLALENAPGFPELTFAGVTSVGGQGSGLAYGPLESQVRSIDLLGIDRNGEPMRTTLGRKQKKFSAAVVSLGAAGVIETMTVEAVPFYFIEERRERKTWPEVAAALPALLERQRLPRENPNALHSVEVWLNPYKVKERPLFCVLGTRAYSKGPVRGRRPRAVRRTKPLIFRVLCRLMRRWKRSVPWLLNIGLKKTTTDDEVVMPWYEGLDFGATNYAEVKAAALAVPIDDLARNIEHLTLGVQSLQTYDQMVTSPLGLRFSKPSKALLAPAFGRESCLIEMPILGCTPKAEQTLEWFAREGALGGRPHWGQRVHLSAEEVVARYPRRNFKKFFDALDELDPKGVFRTDWIKELRVASERKKSNKKRLLKSTPQESADRCGPSDSLGCYSRLFCDQGLLADNPPARTAKEICERLDEAKAAGTKLTQRGAGNALDRQALRPTHGGAYLTLDSSEGSDFARVVIDAQAKTVSVGAAVSWHELVHRTLAQHLLPQVVVTAPRATVGGTLASNSIGQQSRIYGHEAEGLVSVKVAIPGPADKPAEVRELRAPADDDHSDEAELFRAVLGGYGSIGVIVEATYKLVRLGSGDSVDLIEWKDCKGKWKQSPPEYAAITELVPLKSDELRRGLAELRVPRSVDARFRAMVLFWDGKRWAPRLISTHFEERKGRKPKPLISYAGHTFTRKITELALSTMPTVALSGRIAAKETRKPSTHIDPMCGYLFAMMSNQLFKEKRRSRIAFDHIIPTIQMTYVVPDAQALAFLSDVKAILKRNKPANHDKEEDSQPLEPELIAHLAEAEKAAWELSGKSPPEGEKLFSSWTSRLNELPTLLPALFEMVWLPADTHLLSATRGRSGYAVSLSFQGPGVSGRGFRRIHRAIRTALAELAQACEARGGRVHLTKNAFVGDETRAYFRRGLGSSLAEFRTVRDRYDPEHVLSSRFLNEVLGAH